MTRTALLCALGLVGGLLVGHSASAQGVLQGTVTDARGAPLPGANVVLQGTFFGAATNAEGAFSLTGVPAGRYTVTASLLGFEPTTRTVDITDGATLTLRFALREVVLEGEEVIVTASRREERALEAPLSVSVLSPRALEERNIQSLDQALRYVPGVQLSDNQVSIRGASGFAYNVGSRVLLLVDGVPLLGPESDGLPFDALPLSQVAQIEVVKGPGSALYGGGALGGVIQVLTRDFPDTPETSVAAFGGAYAPIRHEAWRQTWSSGDALRPFGGATLTHARRFGDRLGAWVTATYQGDAGYLATSEEQRLQAAAKVAYRPRPSQELALLVSAAGWERDNFLYWNGLRDPLNPGRLDIASSDFSGTNDNRTVQVGIFPSWTDTPSSRWTYTARGRLFTASLRPLDDRGQPRSTDDGTLGFRFGGELQTTYSPSASRTFTAGLTGDGLAVRSSFFQEDGQPRITYGQPEAAAFVQLDQRLRGLVRLVLGLRYDAYWLDTNETEARLSPKLNLSITPRPSTSLRFSYGQGFRVPSLAERFTDNQSFLPIVANLGLRPELSTGYEVGVRRRWALRRATTLEAYVAAFLTNYRRLVEVRFVGTERAFQFVNLTKARTRGTEATLRLRSSRGLEGQVGYTFVDADDQTLDQPLAFRSRHLLITGLTVPLTPLWTVGLDYRYASAPERVESDFARFVPDAEITVDTHVLDLRASVTWYRLRLDLLVNNALNYHYVERPAILAPPRHATVRATVRW
ncbi:MAG: TonB-dependent receptor [Bacteroidota bacterium]